MKIYLLLLITQLSYFQVVGQSATINNNVRSANLLNQLGSYRVTPGDVLFPISSNEKSAIIGDVYLDPRWSVSSLLLYENDHLVDNYLVRFDIKNNEFEFRLQNGVKVLDGAKVKNIVWIDSLTKVTRVMNNGREYPATDVPMLGFFEVLQDGEIQLLKKAYIELVHPNFSPALNVGSKDTKILKKFEYYYSINKKLFKIKKKSSLVAIQEHNSSVEIESLLRKEKINLNDETDLMKLFTILNEKK